MSKGEEELWDSRGPVSLLLITGLSFIYKLGNIGFDPGFYLRFEKTNLLNTSDTMGKTIPLSGTPIAVAFHGQ